jgi:hypothetical protein
LGVQNPGFLCVFSFLIPTEKSDCGTSLVLLFFARGSKQVSERGWYLTHCRANPSIKERLVNEKTGFFSNGGI